jgi:hypothetical protein
MRNGGFNEEYWGVFEGKGKNILGKVMMRVREEFVKGVDTVKWIENNLSLESDRNMLSKVRLTVMKEGKKVQEIELDK